MAPFLEVLRPLLEDDDAYSEACRAAEAGARAQAGASGTFAKGFLWYMLETGRRAAGRAFRALFCGATFDRIRTLHFWRWALKEGSRGALHILKRVHTSRPSLLARKRYRAMVHVEASDGAAAFYLLVLMTVFITCVTPFLVARAAQRKFTKGFFLLTATVAAGARRGRARARRR